MIIQPKSLLIAGLAVAALALSANSGIAEIITFDDLPDGALEPPIPAGYGGVNWSSYFYYMDGLRYSGNPSGYRNGVVSANNVAFNGDSSPVSFSSPVTFTLNSFYITAAWNDRLPVTVSGLFNGSQIYTLSLALNTSGPTFVNLGWSGVNEVRFSSYPWLVPPGDGRGHFALDNLSIDPVPIPPVGTGLPGLILAGCFLGWFRRKRKVAAAAA